MIESHIENQFVELEIWQSPTFYTSKSSTEQYNVLQNAHEADTTSV